MFERRTTGSVVAELPITLRCRFSAMHNRTSKTKEQSELAATRIGCDGLPKWL
jgi:hypothetical protein